MRIGIDVRKYSDYGIGTHIRNLILPAARLVSNAEFVLYHDPSDAPVPDTNFRWVPVKAAKYSLAEHFSIPRKARKDGIGLFHSPHYTLPLRLSCPGIVTVHDLIHLKFSQFYPYWKVKAAELLLRKVIEKAVTVITVSETSKRDILESFPAAESKVEMLYNRLSEDWAPAAQRLDLRQLGIDREYILYVGNFKRHKGIDILLRAHNAMKDPPLLVLAGKSAAMDHELTEMIFSARNTRVLGMVEGELLRQLYSQAILFVFPSLYEGFGYPPLEAMSCGTPVVSSNTPALAEILDDAACLFKSGDPEDLRDKMRTVLEDSALRERLSTAGKARAKKFQTDESCRRLSEIYKRLMK